MEILSDPTPDMLAMPRFDDGAIDMQELLRRLAERVVNAVMDVEADQLRGDGANRRNGYRERALATCMGTLTLRIPKLRSSSFFPEDVIERYQRVDRALVAAVAEMYATGTSTRKVQRVAEKMGVSRLSKDQVSAIASSLDADIEELCGRPLDGSPVPYVWLDATYVKCRRGGRVASTAVVAAIGCDAGGRGARPGRRRGGYRVVRLVARLPANGPRPRRLRGGARRLGHPPGHRPRPRRGLPGRRAAALRSPPHARLHARGRLLAARAPRGQDHLAGVPWARRRHGGGHVPCGVRLARGVLPEGRGGAWGGRARRPGLPRLPAVPLEAAARQQRAGGDDQGDKAQVARGPGIPVHGLARAARRRGHVRAGRDMAGVQVLLGGEDELALRRGA